MKYSCKALMFYQVKKQSFFLFVKAITYDRKVLLNTRLSKYIFERRFFYLVQHNNLKKY